MKTYGDIYDEFCDKFPHAGVEDYRPAGKMYVPQLSEYIPNAIIVWLKDGAKVIYIAGSDSVEPEKCVDCVSRTEVLSTYADWYGYGYNNEFYRLVQQMKSAEPERKMGKWINVDGSTNTADCSCCGNRGRAWMPYCYLCGAKMKVKSE